MSYNLLLQAALADTKKGAAAWEQYCRYANPQEADHLSTALFPLIYRRFSPTSYEYKNVYRHTWCANQMQLAKLKEIVDQLRLASIKPCLLQGAPMLLSYYQDLGTRAFGDLEILISPNERQKTLECLKEMDVRVHTSLFPESRVDQLFQNFTYRKIPAPEFPEATILCPEDQLLITLFQGLKDSFSPRWRVDAVMILRSSPLFDWEYFLSQITRLQLQWPIYKALRSLQQQSLIDLPSSVLFLIEKYQPSIKERSYCRFLRQKPGNYLYVFNLYWQSHLRSAPTKNILQPLHWASSLSTLLKT